MTRRRGLLVATVVVAVLLVGVAMGCRSSGDLRAGGPAALVATADEARLAMTDASEQVEIGVDRFLHLFDDFTPAGVADAARTLYTQDAYFHDGFVELEGAEAIADYLGRSAGHAPALEVEIEDVVHSETGVYVRWLMRFETSAGREVHAPGISHLRFATSGRIIYHRDYWDASGALASMVPIVGPVLDAVRRRL